MRRLLTFLFLFPPLFASKTFSLGVKTLELFDEERQHPVLIECWYPTDATQTDSAVEPREDVEKWKEIWVLPEQIRDAAVSDQQERYPLLLLSHGNCGFRAEQSWFAEKMVQKGYIVAGVEHYGNTWEVYDHTYVCRPWERPMDVRFALDFLLEASPFSSRISLDQIGLCGYSLGGMTALLLAGGILSEQDMKDELLNRYSLPEFLLDRFFLSLDREKTFSSFKDERIKSYLLFAPFANIFHPESLSGISAPMRVLYTLGDSVVPPYEHALKLAREVKTAKVDALDFEAGHYVYLNKMTASGREALPECMYEEHSNINQQEIFERIVQEADLFFQTTLFTMP